MNEVTQAEEAAGIWNRFKGSQAIWRLHELGIDFSVATADGHYDLDVEEVIAAVTKSPAQIAADAIGISLQKYLVFEAFKDSRHQCSGIRRDGKQCRNHCHGPETWAGAEHFVPGDTDRCEHHKEQA